MTNPRRRVGLNRLERAATSLRPIEREVLVLSAREGLSNAAIAERLGITAEAAERHLADAVYGLAATLERRERSWWKCW